MKLAHNNASGVKGVFWCNTTQRWKARAMRGGKVFSLGTYTDLEAAAKAAKDFYVANPFVRKVEHRFKTIGDTTYVYVLNRLGEETETIWDTDIWNEYKEYHICVAVQRTKQYVMITDADSKQWYLHRLVMGNPAGKQVDHLGDSLDNRRSNLCVCSNAENHQNLTPHCDSSSGVRGVYWIANTQLWGARVTIAGKHNNLGSFDTVAEAEAVVKSFRKQHMPFSKEAKECN